MTEQEAYLGIRSFFSAPGAALAKASGGACAYRLDKSRGAIPGNACAIGCLIPDSLYSSVLDDEGGSLAVVIDLLLETNHTADVAPVIEHLFGTANYEIIRGSTLYDFLEQAQELHDSEATSASHFVALLDNLAARRELVVVPA